MVLEANVSGVNNLFPPHTIPNAPPTPFYHSFPRLQVEVAQRTLTSLSTILAKYRRTAPPPGDGREEESGAAAATAQLLPPTNGAAESSSELPGGVTASSTAVGMGNSPAAEVPSALSSSEMIQRVGSWVTAPSSAAAEFPADAAGDATGARSGSNRILAADAGNAPGHAMSLLLPSGGSGTPLLLRRHSDRPLAAAPSILDPAPPTPAPKAPPPSAPLHGGGGPSSSRPASPSIIRPLSLSDVLRRPTR